MARKRRTASRVTLRYTEHSLSPERSVEERIIEGLRDFAETVKSGKALTDHYTCKSVVVDLEPTSYGPKEVRATRKLLSASQAVFAKFLGVSVKTVRAWEQGTNAPRDVACRFMDEIRINPVQFRKRLHDSVHVKESR
jgi:putative transcriptional regulator